MTPEERAKERLRMELQCRRICTAVGVSQEAWKQFEPYLSDAIREAYENAAKVVEEMSGSGKWWSPRKFAAAIRALKETPK